MKGKDIINTIMDKESVTKASMARKLNISPAAVWDRLNNKSVKDISVSTLVEMLRVLDYKVQVVPGSARLPDGGYEVD